jgi:diaminohydroxyphosphoribosylaminopyrimidine deaminase / 5-amino-6-(5-phosphoribosylamino)uracil reductase
MYEDLVFPQKKLRPFFYTNFVSTIDGKTLVKIDPQGYWPIGSKVDHDVLMELRAHADVLLQGKNTALFYRTLNTLAGEKFRAGRRMLGKNAELPYLVMSSTPDDRLIAYMDNWGGPRPLLVTTEEAVVSKELADKVRLIRLGKDVVDVELLAAFLHKEGFKNVLVEAGPTLLSTFLEHDLIDEIFLTLAPKIFGNSNNATYTMAEGYLFPPNKIKQCRLLSVKQVGDEVFLRYNILDGAN